MPHLFLKDPSLTTIAVPAWIDLDMFISVVLGDWYWVFRVSGNSMQV